MEISKLIEYPRYIIFKISDLEFCINVKDVHIIKRLEEPEFYCENAQTNIFYFKIYNINIPIIDISSYYNLNKEDINKLKILLIIKHYSEHDNLEKTFGILADEVIEIISADKSESNYLLNFTPSDDNPYLSGSIFWGERKILLPNFSRIAASISLKEREVH